MEMNGGNQISCAILFAGSLQPLLNMAFKVDIVFHDLRLDVFKTIGSRKHVAYTTLYSSVVNCMVNVENTSTGDVLIL